MRPRARYAGCVAGTRQTRSVTYSIVAHDPSTGALGVAVYVWHGNREGGYSLYSDGITGEIYLRVVRWTWGDAAVRRPG